MTFFILLICFLYNNVVNKGNYISKFNNILKQGVGNPVTILIEEDGVIVDCSLKTQEPDEILDFDMDPQTVVNKVLLQSELLKDVLAELDPSSSHMEVL